MHGSDTPGRIISAEATPPIQGAFWRQEALHGGLGHDGWLGPPGVPTPPSQYRNDTLCLPAVPQQHPCSLTSALRATAAAAQARKAAIQAEAAKISMLERQLKRAHVNHLDARPQRDSQLYVRTALKRLQSGREVLRLGTATHRGGEG